MGSTPSIPTIISAFSGELRRITPDRLRAVTGAIMGLYVVLHLTNHSLGLISIGAQEFARPWIMAFWHSPLGQIALYGSLITHAALGLRSLALRRHFRIPLWEKVQLLSGLLIPYLLLVHIVNTRGIRISVGTEIDYEYEVAHLWVKPWLRYRQVMLVLLVWGHFAAGIHYAFRFRAGYKQRFPLILALLLFVPALGLLGFAESGKVLAARPQEWWAHIMSLGVSSDARVMYRVATLKELGPAAWLALVALVYAGGRIRNARERQRHFTVTYPEGRAAKAPVGMTVLEVSRMIRRPHASVCGGRARCTTCRVRVQQCVGELPAPSETEARSLRRLQAPASLRLACQLRPHHDIHIEPLVDLSGAMAADELDGQRSFGEEMCVTVLFLDVRGSTKLAEHRLPYDVVFVMSRFFAEMAHAVESAGGHYSNFTGDGLMALFGLKGSARDGARAALACSLDMHERLERINESMAGELDTPLKIGVGIHTGEAIVGEMGPPQTPVLTALGDTVNTTARIESLTKEFGVPVLASLETLGLAGLEANVPVERVQLRGRTSALEVALLDLDSLALCLLEQSPTTPATDAD